jgi:dephospho-CoA kinase
MNIIGLVGPIACGKGIVAEYLIKQYGYVSFSLSSIIHDEVKKRKIKEFSRTTLQDIGDELRKKEGDGVLAKRAMKKLSDMAKGKARKVIIEGIRNPGEVQYLRTMPGFFLIAVDAPQKIRYQRVLKRAKSWDPKNWKSFQKVDGRDKGDSKNTNGQQVRKCMDLADIKIKNNKTLTDVYKEMKMKLSEHLLR